MHFATKQWVGYDPEATHEAAGGNWPQVAFAPMSTDDLQIMLRTLNPV